MRHFIIVFISSICCSLVGGGCQSNSSSASNQERIDYTAIQDLQPEDRSTMKDSTMIHLTEPKNIEDSLEDSMEIPEEELGETNEEVLSDSAIHALRMEKLGSPWYVAVLDLETEILTALEEEDYESLAEYFHPIEGVRFTKNTHIYPDDVQLKKEEFLDLLRNPDHEPIDWGGGEYDEEMGHTFLRLEDFIQNIIYSAPFLYADTSSIDEEIAQTQLGNNRERIYKDCTYTERHFTGFEPLLYSYDWCSLQLVFTSYEDKPWLVGLISIKHH